MVIWNYFIIFSRDVVLIFFEVKDNFVWRKIGGCFYFFNKVVKIYKKKGNFITYFKTVNT